MDVNAAVDGLRARVRAAWPCTRDLVFTYRAGDRDPHDFEAALPEIELPQIAHAIFAKLAPDRSLSALQPVHGHTYDWGEDQACVTAEGDGVLVADYAVRERVRDGEPIADYAVRERVRDGGPSRTLHHVVILDDACAMIENGSRTQRIAQPRIVVWLSARTDAIDAATDAILEIAPAFGLAFVERIDAPVRVVRPRRPSAAVRAFAQVLACKANATAHQFAWIIIGMVPGWFGFAGDTFSVEPGPHSSVDLVWKSPRHAGRRARVRLSSSRNIDCVATDRDANVDRASMDMHYVPSVEHYEHARMMLLCALRWLLPDHPVDELPAEVVARIPPDRVFPGPAAP